MARMAFLKEIKLKTQLFLIFYKNFTKGLLDDLLQTILLKQILIAYTSCLQRLGRPPHKPAHQFGAETL